MTTCLASFLFAFVLAVIFTYAVRASALLLGVVDKPDSYRKIHTRAVPRLGGIAIYAAFFLTLAVLYWFVRNQVSDLLLARPVQLLGILAGATVAMAMGIVDDVRAIRARWKLLFQVIAATIAWAAGLSINAISNPFGPPLVLGALSFPITLFWFVGCMNAVNLMDGLDGLAAGVCLFVTVTLFLVSLLFTNVLGMLLMAILSGATFGFLLFNFYPARIFLGDSGSMLLGFLVAALALVSSTRKAETAIALLIPVVALGVPIFDTSLAIVRRWYKKLPLASPDRQHVHHVLLSMGYSQRRAVLLLYSVTLLLGVAALLITIGRNEVTVLVLGALAIIAFVSIRVLGGLRIEDLLGRFSEAQARRRLFSTVRASIEEAFQRMQEARTVGGLWESCSKAFAALDLDYATLRLCRPDGSPEQAMSWMRAGTPVPEDTRDVWTGRLALKSNGDDFGSLEIGKKVNEAMPLVETPELIYLIRRDLTVHLARLKAGAAAFRREPAAHETIGE